jgi:hypothetical protein
MFGSIIKPFYPEYGAIVLAILFDRAASQGGNTSLNTIATHGV